MAGLYPPTATVTQHARERCAEMGISTKVVKAIVRNPDLTRPCRNSEHEDGHCRMAVSSAYPDYAVVYDPDLLRVVTVVFRTTEDYRRCGDHFEASETQGMLDNDRAGAGQ